MCEMMNNVWEGFMCMVNVLVLTLPAWIFMLGIWKLCEITWWIFQ